MSRIGQSELSVQLRLQINTLKALIRPFRFSRAVQPFALFMLRPQVKSGDGQFADVMPGCRVVPVRPPRMTWYDIQIESRRLPPLRPLPVRPIVPVPNPSSTSSSAFSSAAAYRHMLHGSNGNATTNGTKRASASVDEALSSGPMHKKVKSETYITVLDESNRPQQPSASAFSSHSMNAPPQRLRATRCSR